MTFDLTVGVPEKTVLKNEGEIALNDLNKPCHGVALWMEYRLTDAKTVSGGLLKVREREKERCICSCIQACFNNFINTFLFKFYY